VLKKDKQNGIIIYMMKGEAYKKSTGNLVDEV
jgi:hypothetical protein